MAFVEHRFGRTYYQSRGRKTAKGAPLICLHGGPGGHSRFMTELFKLADERKVYLYDQVGGGRSSATRPNRWTVETFVRELDYLLDAWEVEDFHLFGASWGTTLALEYYLHNLGKKRKQRSIKSIVFQSPMFSAKDWSQDAERLIRRMSPEHQKVIRYCHEIEATDSSVYQEAMKEYYARHVCRNPERTRRAAKYPNPNGNLVYEYMWGASEFSATGTLKHYDRVKELKRVTCPTLFICGEHDEATPQTAARYSGRMKNASHMTIKGASHSILSEKPAMLLKAIRRHLMNCV